MKIKYIMCKCINCGISLEVTSQDLKDRQTDCPECGYTNELNDHRLELWEEEK